MGIKADVKRGQIFKDMNVYQAFRASYTQCGTDTNTSLPWLKNHEAVFLDIK